MMKVVFLNTFESSGGAAIASKRLMIALQKNGIEVKMIVRDKQTDNNTIISINKNIILKAINLLRFVWERFIIWIHHRFSKENLFTVSIANTGYDLCAEKEIQVADIIHIHWINQGFLSLRTLKKLAESGKPIVCTMHDMWPVTGICHHARECVHFTKECGHCPFLKTKKYNDLSHKIFLAKRKAVFANKNVTFAGCSAWIADKARISGLSKNHSIRTIPNPIDIHTFKVMDKLSARRDLGLPDNKKLLLFGAANVTDQRKGIYYLVDACNELIHHGFYTELCLVVFGHAKKAFKELFNIPIYHIGYLNQAEKIVMLYNAVDLFVIPSLEENLPNTIMESMACGTPCVGFQVGGIPEMIDHKQNGYVAEYKNAEDLAKGIHWVLTQADYTALSNNARQKVESTYSEDIVAKQYIELYKEIQ